MLGSSFRRKLIALSVAMLHSALFLSCFAQVAQNANDWQATTSSAVNEPNDEASRKQLLARGAVFDEFAPSVLADGSASPDPSEILYSPGSVGIRPELPMREGEAIVLGTFSSHLAHLSPSGRSVYTEIIFTPHVVLKSGPAHLQPGVAFSVLESGGAVQTPDGRVFRTAVALREFGLIPRHKYLAFLRYSPRGNFYELTKTWDVTTGVAVPNAPEDAKLASEGRSAIAGLSELNLVAKVKAMMASR